MRIVNKGKNFFQKHKHFTPIPNLFTVRFELFIESVNFNDMTDWPVNNICEKKECKKEFFKKEGGAKTKDQSNKITQFSLRMPV